MKKLSLDQLVMGDLFIVNYSDCVRPDYEDFYIGFYKNCDKDFVYFIDIYDEYSFTLGFENDFVYCDPAETFVFLIENPQNFSRCFVGIFEEEKSLRILKYCEEWLFRNPPSTLVTHPEECVRIWAKKCIEKKQNEKVK